MEGPIRSNKSATEVFKREKVTVPWFLAKTKYEKKSSSVFSHGRAGPTQSITCESVVFQAPLSML
jgi:hypothetical protein